VRTEKESLDHLEEVKYLIRATFSKLKSLLICGGLMILSFSVVVQETDDTFFGSVFL
jgi:hypothetical protein